MDYKFTFKCPLCGSDSLQLPDNPTDDSRAKCGSCGVDLGRWGDIQRAATEAAIDDVKEDIKDMLRKLQG